MRVAYLGLVVLSLAAASPALAEHAYGGKPPVRLPAHEAQEWVEQLRGPRSLAAYEARPQRRRLFQVLGDRKERQAHAAAPAVARQAPVVRQAPPRAVQAAAPARRAAKTAAKPARKIDPIYLPAVVDYETRHPPGTIVIDTKSFHLYLVMPDGKARRYGVGVGREGFGWSGTVKIGRKAEWPDWRPPAEMRKRQPHLPTFMAGGPGNPLGARAMYLYDDGRDTLFRIHGTNEPWTIGQNISSGCIRLRNEDVIDLYGRVKVGARVVVL